MMQPLCVGFLGRLTKQKNVSLLIDAFAEAFPAGASGALLTVAGSGPEEGLLRRRCEDLNITDRVQWRGSCTASVMREFDVFALPSLYEGMPYVLLEALEARLPVVATAVGGVRSVIEDGIQGFVVQPGDCAGFASALLRLASDPALRLQMSQSAARRVSQFTLSRMVNETIGVYEKAIYENFRDPGRLTAAEVP